MSTFLHFLSDWSEIWALFIPLYFMLRHKSQDRYLKPVRLYIWIALILNICIVFVWKYKVKLNLPDSLQSNNFLYNIHSIARFLLFSWFFILLDQGILARIKQVISICFIVFVLLNFFFLEDFFYFYSFSGRLLSIETGVLLIYCLQYYFLLLREDSSPDRRPPSFWVVTGLSIYVVINFPIFLFYRSFYEQFETFAIGIWDVTNISFTIFCILLAKSFYESRLRHTQHDRHS